MTIISNCFAVIGLIMALVFLGMGVGFGFAIGLELVMRLSGDGRTVLLTWARTKTGPRP